MPELPEVESARGVLAGCTLRRAIVAVDDVDSYVCRPHRAEDFRDALVGARFTGVHRQGKSLLIRARDDTGSRPALGLHLGMGGRLVVTDADGPLAGGDSTHGLAGPAHARWFRLSVHFADGRTLHLVDKRRLGRAVLDPDLSRLGPDALDVGLAAFRAALGASKAPVKARLMDQSVIAGIGNLLADETLWRARIDPATPTVELPDPAITTLHRSMRAAVQHALRHGGSHTGRVIPARVAGGSCPRCGAPMRRARIGGRTTWSCSAEQGGDAGRG